MLPEAFGPGSDKNTLTQLFYDKGFDATDLAALIGAHTVSQAFTKERNRIPPGGPQDSTPTQWDTNYYQQLKSDPQGVYHFQSDVNLYAGGTGDVGSQMARFAGSQSGFNSAFATAMGKMNLLGVPAGVVSEMVDCTSVIENL